MFACIKLEKIRLSLTGSLRTFDKGWRSFLDYLLFFSFLVKLALFVKILRLCFLFHGKLID